MNVTSVLKIGGSLLEQPDLPDLPARLLATVRAHGGSRPLLVIGGGPTVDLIRNWDRMYDLGEEVSHWISVHALSVNSRVLESILPGSRFVGDLAACETAWKEEGLPILESFRFLHDIDAARPDPLPRRWSVTSDSIAARMAVHYEAPRLVLVKSTTIPAGLDVSGASREGYVDPHFAVAARGIPEIIAVNSTADTATPVRTVIASAARGGILTAGSTT